MSVGVESRKLVQDAKLFLCTITYPGGVLRFTDSIVDPLIVVGFDSEAFLARKFKVDRFRVGATTALARPKLSIDNTDRFFYSLLDNFDDLLGATVLLQTVYRQNLDGWSDPDPTQKIEQASYVIIQKLQLDSQQVQFKLAVPQDVEQAQLGRLMLRHSCPRQYRVPTDTDDTFIDVNTVDGHVDCPYVGSSYFTEANEATADHAEDKCSFTQKGCKLRFGETGALPYMGFPSLGDPNA